MRVERESGRSTAGGEARFDRGPYFSWAEKEIDVEIEMNGLELFLHREGMDRHEALNVLKDHAVISDNCIALSDVCTSDCLVAVTFLIHQKGELAL